MLGCRIFRFLWRWVPAKSFQDLLLRFHAKRCPFCQEDLASPEEARKLLWQPEQMSHLEGFWQSLDWELELRGKKIATERATFFPVKPRLWKRLVAGAAALFLATLAAYFFFQERRFEARGREAGHEGSEERFGITRMRTGIEPANPIIYRPFGSNHIFIWVEKSKEKETEEDSP